MKQKILDAITSKKFVCLMIAVIVTLLGHMSGSDLVVVMSIYMGVEVMQKSKWIDK
jgi:hypothetical protein